MKAELISSMGSDLSAVNAARVSMDKESDWEERPYAQNLQTGELSLYGPMPGHLKEADAKLIKYLADHNHASCFEHQAATLRLKVPIFVARQIHRHRTFSYNEVSRRYVKDNLEFYWPDKWRKAAPNVKQGSSDIEWDEDSLKDWAMPPKELVEYAVQTYEAMVNQGCCPEQARMILPQNLYTQFYMTGNLRNWVHFLKLRLDKHAQAEIRDIAQQCAALIEPLFPVSYKALMEAK